MATRKDSENKPDNPPPTPAPVTVAPPVSSSNPFVPRAPAAPGQFTFVPSNYQPFQQATGYGYDDWLAQVRDSLSMPTRGAGIFGNNGGNNMPRYAFGNRPDSMHPGSGFNASSFLAPYLAAIQPPGGGGGAPVPGGPGAPPGPPPAMPPPAGLLGARGLAPGFAPGTGLSAGSGPVAGAGPAGGARGFLGPMPAQSQGQNPMAAFIAQLLAQQNMSGPGGMRGGR